MPEPFDVTCSICGTPMLPNLSQADADGCLWICIDPDCPELCAGELETEDLAGGGVSTSWGSGSDVEDQALAARLVRLIDSYEDTIEELHAQGAGHGEEGADAGGGGVAAPPLAGSRERAQADLASLRRQVCELRRRRPRRRRRRRVGRRHGPQTAGAARHGRCPASLRLRPPSSGPVWPPHAARKETLPRCLDRVHPRWFTGPALRSKQKVEQGIQ